MKQKIITRTILLVSLVSLFTDIASEMLYPVMPVYLRSIGFSVLLIGILEGLAEATAGLSKGYFGNLSDTLGKRVPFVRIGYALSAVSKPLMAIFIQPLWIFFARTLDRLGKGVRTSARDAILSDETTPEHKGRVFGFHRSMDTLGAAIGPVMALIFLALFPKQYKWLFIIAFLPGVMAVLLTFLVRDKAKGQHLAKKSVSFFTYLKYWNIANANYKKLVIGLLAFTLFNSSDAFLLLVLKEKDFSDVAMIGFYIFYNLCYALLSYPVGILADKIGLKRVLVAGMLLFVVVYGAISFASGIVFLGFIFGVYGIYASATEGVSKALITNLSDKSDTATAIGFYSSFSSVFALLASSLGGFIWFTFSPKAMFLVSAVSVLLVVIYFTVIFRRKK
ncbi:MAG: MFS transporter [Bacteroidota bacterium]|nr:MFS transporter [Bacteroidota bacterium]